MSRVMATANTPSLKASTRPVSFSSIVYPLKCSLHMKILHLPVSPQAKQANEAKRNWGTPPNPRHGAAPLATPLQRWPQKNLLVRTPPRPGKGRALTSRLRSGPKSLYLRGLLAPDQLAFIVDRDCLCQRIVKGWAGIGVVVALIEVAPVRFVEAHFDFAAILSCIQAAGCTAKADFQVGVGTCVRGGQRDKLAADDATAERGVVAPEFLLVLAIDSIPVANGDVTQVDAALAAIGQLERERDLVRLHLRIGVGRCVVELHAGRAISRCSRWCCGGRACFRSAV